MSTLDVPAIGGAGLKAEAVLDGIRIRLHFSGVAESKCMARLHLFLTKVHFEAVRHQAGEVVVEIGDLEFMSSSCLKTLVTWIGEVRESEPHRQYRIRFVCKPERLWQRRSMDALRCLAKEVVSVEP